MPAKLERLRRYLSGLGRVLIAYSGGVDSTFLLKVAHDVLGDKVLAVIARSPTYPEDEARYAVAMCETLGVRRRVIKTAEFSDQKFLSNPPDRCYYCKSELFRRLRQIARRLKIPHILDGSNVDDRSDYRPGSRAKKEAKVISPLADLGLTKKDIRRSSRKLGLTTWDKPAAACLASRIPYGTRITRPVLKKIEEGERFLRSLGFRQLRVRHHGAIARIELEKTDIAKVVKRGLLGQIHQKFERLGYTFVTLDLKGYRVGSLNESLGQ